MIKRSDFKYFLLKNLVPFGLITCIFLLVIQDVFDADKHFVQKFELSFEERDLDVEELDVRLLRAPTRHQQVYNNLEFHAINLLPSYIDFYNCITSKPAYYNAYTFLLLKKTFLRSHIQMNAP